MRMLDEPGRALLDAGSMTWQITWSLILGFIGASQPTQVAPPARRRTAS